MNYINTFVHIKNNGYFVNGRKTGIKTSNELSIENALYKHLEIEYPKFYKMDLLSKIAFLGAEIIIKNTPQISQYNDQDIALLFANKESSLHTDIKFQKSIDKNNPSPSLFVYTLPNILLGEIAIKNKWYGENLFLILPKFNTQEICQQIDILLNEDSVACLGGWINVCNNELDAFFYFAEQTQTKQSIPLNESELLKLYENYGY